MSDRLDTRIRSFVVELLDDPPEAPPFPHPGVAVITGGRSQRRESMIDTKTRQDPATKRRKPWQGPAIAVGTFAAIVIAVIVMVAINNATDNAAPVAGTLTDPEVVTDSATPETTTLAEPLVVIDSDNPAAALPGRAWTTVDGRAASRPDTIEFAEDGTYRVIDQFRTVDTGVYRADGDSITFESDPTDEVMWIFNDMFLRTPRSCEGMVGEYRLSVTQPGRIKLDVVWDECEPRITYANGLQIEAENTLK